MKDGARRLHNVIRIVAAFGRMLLVRKAGAAAFLQPSGKRSGVALVFGQGP